MALAALASLGNATPRRLILATEKKLVLAEKKSIAPFE